MWVSGYIDTHQRKLLDHFGPPSKHYPNLNLPSIIFKDIFVHISPYRLPYIIGTVAVHVGRLQNSCSSVSLGDTVIYATSDPSPSDK